MMHLLERHAGDARRTEVCRLAVAAVALAVTSVCWHGLRPHLIRWAACSSIGCPGRERLLAAGLRQSDPSIPLGRSMILERVAGSYCAPGVGMTWLVYDWAEAAPSGRPGFGRWRLRHVVADSQMHVRGSVLYSGGVLLLGGDDMDRDGSWEAIMVPYSAPQGALGKRGLWGWVVVRLGKTANEIVWFGIVDQRRWPLAGRSWLRPMWRDEDGDGRKELVLANFPIVSWLPTGEPNFGPAQTVAVFEWDAPGGVLRPRVLPRNAGVSIWHPPNGRPLSFALGSDLDEILPRLLSGVEGFGQCAKTQPATTRAR